MLNLSSAIKANTLKMSYLYGAFRLIKFDSCYMGQLDVARRLLVEGRYGVHLKPTKETIGIQVSCTLRS